MCLRLFQPAAPRSLRRLLGRGAPEQSMLVLTCWNRQHGSYPSGTAVELFR